MKTGKYKKYAFEKLPYDIQDKVCEDFATVNLEEDWWDSIYDRFKLIAAFFGFNVDLKKTYFNGFYNGSQASCYTASINIIKAIQCLQQKQWEKQFPQESLHIGDCDFDSRVVSLIERGFITGSGNVQPSDRESSIFTELRFKFPYNNCTNYDSIERELNCIQDDLIDLALTLNFWLFTSLRKEYDFLTSKKQVRETIINAQYKFNRNGEQL